MLACMKIVSNKIIRSKPISFAVTNFSYNSKFFVYRRYFSTNTTNQNTDSNLSHIKDILKDIKTQDGKTIQESNMIYDIKIDSETKKIKILLNLHKDYIKIKNIIEKKFKESPYFKEYDKIEVTMAPAEKKSESLRKLGLKNVKNIIAVSSCKGGVGKSTVAVNLAFSLMMHNKKVGIFDADIYGPSLPTMINPSDTSLRSYEDNPQMIVPIEFSGIKAMSFGYASPNRRAIVRGPIVSNIVTQLVCNTDWGDLDYLVVDMPPGTGDIQISLCQELNFTGGVVVTTPQKLSFIDVVKGIEMLDELKIPVLSVVENMSYYICDKCDEKHFIFGKGYVDMLKKQFGIEDSFNIPIDSYVSRASDSGSPYVLVSPDSSAVQQTFRDISQKIIDKVKNLNEFLENRPKVEYSPKEEAIKILFNKDKVKLVDPYLLRKKCICAACIDEFTGEKLLKEKQIPKDVHPSRIEDKGNYAVAIVWSDGHRSSIYPYKRLLSSDIEEKKLNE